MKSIKEKAEEYTSVIENQVTNNAAFLAYRSGANYVLECIEEATNICFDEELRNVIKQLKK